MCNAIEDAMMSISPLLGGSDPRGGYIPVCRGHKTTCQRLCKSCGTFAMSRTTAGLNGFVTRRSSVSDTFCIRHRLWVERAVLRHRPRSLSELS